MEHRTIRRAREISAVWAGQGNYGPGRPALGCGSRAGRNPGPPCPASFPPPAISPRRATGQTFLFRHPSPPSVSFYRSPGRPFQRSPRGVYNSVPEFCPDVCSSVSAVWSFATHSVRFLLPCLAVTQFVRCHKIQSHCKYGGTESRLRSRRRSGSSRRRRRRRRRRPAQQKAPLCRPRWRHVHRRREFAQQAGAVRMPVL